MTRSDWMAVCVWVGLALALCGGFAQLIGDWKAASFFWMLCAQAMNGALCLARREERGLGKGTVQGSVPQSHGDNKPVDYWE